MKKQKQVICISFLLKTEQSVFWLWLN